MPRIRPGTTRALTKEVSKRERFVVGTNIRLTFAVPRPGARGGWYDATHREHEEKNTEERDPPSTTISRITT